MNILIATVGLPRSGKTTWARSKNLPIVNPDSIRLAIHGQRFVAEAEPFVWATAQVMVASLFLAGHCKVILDATNTSRDRRNRFKSDKWVTSFKLINTGRDECIRRATEVGDTEIIPIIERMHAAYETLGNDELQWDY
jgi:predicted kinase